ncbi:MAG: nuclear transport factor 2 family protein [Maribacter sp.]|nr:nuclear transport factor 2 family protein [Maribacter sp.]
MKKLINIWIILFFLCACNMPKKNTVGNNEELEKSSVEIEQLILEKEKDAFNSYAAGSFTGFTKHYDDEVTYLGARNRIDGLPAMRAYTARLDSIGAISKHRYEVINPKVQVYQDMAIITLQYHPYSSDNTPETKWKATSVYALMDNDWKVVHAHWSVLNAE